MQEIVLGRRLLSDLSSVRPTSEYGEYKCYKQVLILGGKSRAVGEAVRVVYDITISVKRLRIANIPTERIWAHKAPNPRVVVASECIVEACFGIALEARKLIILRA
jgi:hypothetical protein